MSDPGERAPTDLRHLARHGAGFLTSGAIAFSVDAIILLTLTKGLGIGPFLARLIAISCAMVAGWQAHRRLTFAVETPSSTREFARYAAVAWMSAALNYAVYSAILLAREGTEPFLALVLASLVAMFFSYAGMRLAVFRRSWKR